MILATNSGWLIVVEKIHETSRRTVVKDVEGKLYTVRKLDVTRKLFDSTQPAIDWITSWSKT